MKSTLVTRLRLYPAFAEMFAYPTPGFEQRRAQAMEVISALVPEASKGMARFDEATADKTLYTMEEVHTRTFDIMAQCDPYVSSQVFGQESYKRGQLMVGLAEAYRSAGLEWGSELPDHFAIILKNIACFSDEEWPDMIEHCFREAVSKMGASLKACNNPYTHLFGALDCVLDWDIPGDPEAKKVVLDFPLGVLDAEITGEATRA